jgi:hypothetical protein
MSEDHRDRPNTREFAQIGTHENWLEQHPYLNMDAMTRRLTGHWTLNLLA